MTVTSPPEVISASGPAREPVSPELVLVDAELAARERARSDQPARPFLSAEPRAEPVPGDARIVRGHESHALRALASGAVLFVGVVTVLMLTLR